MFHSFRFFPTVLLAVALLACLYLVFFLAPSAPVQAKAHSDPKFTSTLIVAPTATAEPAQTQRAEDAPTLTATPQAPQAPKPDLPARAWMQQPVIPTLSPRALEIFQRGQALGNRARAFSKIGDGEISAFWFLSEFDQGPAFYDLGLHQQPLQPTLDYFAGSYGRISQAARRGFNTSRILDPSLADSQLCQPGETPLDCEIRLHRPAFALISLGTNQIYEPQIFETGLRKIVETLIRQGVVPVLSTKGDNKEGDYEINEIIARLAYQYDLPLWNFWREIQPLPNHGLQDDLEHLTMGANDFDDPYIMEKAWPHRNLTALQVLNQLMNETQP